jgi:phospholipid transport system substrate-binding protein
MKCLITLAALAAIGTGVARAAEVDANDPAKLIETTAQAMLDDINAHRAEYKADSTKVQALVDRLLLPHFDTAYSAQLVLGQHWRAATADQRRRFIDAFYKSLLKNYGASIAEFSGDRLKVLPSKTGADPTHATVRTQVRKDDGTFVPVNYSLHKTDAGWKAWDVNVEGISYVKSFRDDFGSQIDSQGLDAVIKRLESGENPVKKPS